MDEIPTNTDQPNQSANDADPIKRDTRGRILPGQKLRRRQTTRPLFKQVGSAARPLSRPSATRAQFNRRFIADFAAHWELRGRAALQRLERESPANYVKLAAFLVPRQMEVETKSGVKGLTDAQLEEAIAAVKAMLDARAAGIDAKLIEASDVSNVSQLLPSSSPAENDPSDIKDLGDKST